MKNILLGVLTAAFVLFLESTTNAQSVVQGTGLVCDTAQQVLDFSKNYNGDAQATLATINKDAVACAIVTIAFVEGAEVATSQDKTGFVSVREVVVVGAFENGVWTKVVPMKQYIAVRLPDRGI